MTEQTKAERIAAARKALADRRAADPAGVERYEARMAHLSAAAKRERERFETRVLGRPPEPPPLPPKPKGMSRAAWKVEKARLRDEAAASATLAAKWSHKQGTPETLEHASRTHEGALAQLHRNGVLDSDQLAWAEEIAAVADIIAAGAKVRTLDLEARVDPGRNAHDAVGESVARARAQVAYTAWRAELPVPKALVLDMLTGERIGYSVAARRHHAHPRRARQLLIAALDRWPRCKDDAARNVGRAEIKEIEAKIA